MLHSLETWHRRFCVSVGDARRYVADVLPFAAVVSPSVTTLKQLSALLAPGESVWLIGHDYPQIPELSVEESLECFQMVLPEDVTLPNPNSEVVRLPDQSAPEMVELTNLAFPGFFRERTCEIGSYYGVRSNGRLIAMGGERMFLDRFVEISAVCTHPEHRGKGLAAAIIARLARNHRRDGLVSWLHVSCTNRNAIELYLRMEFQVARRVTVRRIRRKV